MEKNDADVAQTEEQQIRNLQGTGSIPVVSSTPAPPRAQVPDTFTSQGNLVWVDWSGA